ncbi:uncharacterized protein LOC126852895 [Cataglyphis hispanica]|uniref:uncharacterized protein LOC126852895 n=1 Tax=Cataglyphis hispanica TaxID=1086592 RepID=UPI0021805CF4|nr:uncharacterized protein LOC126852895 [Cataglyphis hispanica]
MSDIFNIGGEPVFDDRIVKIETHTYNPYANTTFEHNDKIRIPIQQQDLYTLPYESFLYIEGKLTLNNQLKDLITVIMKNPGWDAQNNANEYFNFGVPLYMLLGFCEDYKRIVIKARRELILIRSRNDNCLIGNLALEPVINIFKIQWRMPRVISNKVNKLSMLRALESERYLSMGFRSWDMYEFSLLQRTIKHSWAIKTAIQLEKPRYVVFALQTGRKNVMSEETNRFDDCKLNNVKLYLNSECYPYDDMILDFDKNRWSIPYDTYQRFCKNYYGYEYLEPSLTVTQFLRNGDQFVINCFRENKSVKSATVDVRLEFECKENVPMNTIAYCFTIHDRVI